LKFSSKRAKAEAAKLQDWTLTGNVITRGFRFDDFADAMRFVNKVAEIAEAANHHPDFEIRYNKVRLTLTTHDEGGLTAKDFKLAAKISRLVK
jgi:4a-hydroxytetrahydrobiopterin dehydratase